MANNISQRQGMSLGPFKGFAGKAPRHPLNAATAAQSAATTSVQLRSLKAA